MVLGTTVPGTGIKFLAGGVNSSNVAVSINNPGTAPTSVSTGALVVVGGVGISGNMNVGQYNTSLHNIRGNLLLGLGNIIASADSILTINQNSTTPFLAPNNIVHMSAMDGRNAQYGADSFGPSAVSGIYFRKARGVSASPSAVQANDLLGFMAARGFGATNFANSITTAPSYVGIFAAENYTDTNQGTYIGFRANPTGSITSNLVATMSPGLTSMYSSNVTVYGSFTALSGIAFTCLLYTSDAADE